MSSKYLDSNNPEHYILRRNWCGNTYKLTKSYRFTIILGLLRFSALLTFLIDDEFWRHHISSGLSRLPARAQAELFLLFRIEAVKLVLPLSAASSSHVIALWQRCICNIKRCTLEFRIKLVLPLFEMYILVCLETYTIQISFAKTFCHKTFWGCQKLLLLFEGSHSSCHTILLRYLSFQSKHVWCIWWCEKLVFEIFSFMVNFRFLNKFKKYYHIFLLLKIENYASTVLEQCLQWDF